MPRKYSHQQIVERQRDKKKDPRLPLCVVLNDLRSLHNVGSIFRTCDAVGVEKLWLCGITGYPPARELTKTALGAEDHVPWEYASDALIVLGGLKERGYQIVLVEQAQEAIPHDVFEPQAPVCLVIGNEINGVEEALVAICDKTVEIEMAGVKNSLNAAVAFGIVAYQMRTKIKQAKKIEMAHAA